MTRQEYLTEQKRKGRRVFGIFPAQYPKEILWAMDVLPMEIWDPPMEISRANAHLQSYICSVVKLGLELVLQGKCEDLDGFIFPHTCDSIQNMASVVYDYLGMDKPCYFFYHPKAPYGPSSRQFYLEQLQEFAADLERQLGPLEINKLAFYVERAREIGRLYRSLYDLRAENNLGASNQSFYSVVRSGEYLHPDDLIPLLKDFIESGKGASRPGPAVILSGVLPNPREILSMLDELGVRVAHDDLLACSRRVLVPEAGAGDPFRAMTEAYFAMPPCSTKGSSIADRLDYLLRIIESCGAGGVIFNVVKFCETELFDVPQLVEELKGRGLATLVLDTEINQAISGQLSTRIEAFAEMMA